METCDTPDDDAAALKARRERLRAVATQIAEVVETIALPDTFLEAERAARTVTIADRMILRLPPDEPEAAKPARQRLRVFGDRLLDAIERLTLPDTFEKRSAHPYRGTRPDRLRLVAGPPKTARWRRGETIIKLPG